MQIWELERVHEKTKYVTIIDTMQNNDKFLKVRFLL